MVSAKEEPDVPIPPAMDGLLKVHKRIVDVNTDPAHAPPGAGGTVTTRMLVAATQGGSLIGKQGATIKTIQDASNCTIRVLGGENLPVFALPDDSVVEVQGEPAGVHKAVELIATHLRKFLVDRSVIGIFESQMQMPNARGNQDMPPPQSWGPPPQGGFPMNVGGGPGFVPNPQYMPPPRQFDNYYSPADMPSMDKQPRQGPPPAYGRDASMGTHTTSMQPQQSMVTKVSQNMQIQLAYADAVIGTSGSNISYIRRASGATIAIQETRGIPVSWPLRQKIALGTARGLSYLHYGVTPAIIHRDIKGSNILLDETFEPKVADFGLAKFAPEGATHVSTRVAGTMGYVSPEYALYGQLTERSDVYSFGVVLLEILSGKKALLELDDEQHTLLADWAWSLVRKGRALDIIEEGIPELGPPEVMEKYVLLSVLCSHPQLYARPTMDQVVKILETDLPVPMIPERPIPLTADIDDIEKSISSTNSGHLSSYSGYQPYTVDIDRPSTPKEVGS